MSSLRDTYCWIAWIRDALFSLSLSAITMMRVWTSCQTYKWLQLGGMDFPNSIKKFLHLQQYSLAGRTTWADAAKYDTELRLSKVKASMKLAKNNGRLIPLHHLQESWQKKNQQTFISVPEEIPCFPVKHLLPFKSMYFTPKSSVKKFGRYWWHFSSCF